MQLSYNYGYNHGEWCAVIIDNDTSQIVTIGVEFSEPAIQQWCEATLASWPVTGREAPDAYDRRS